ncbi:MAG: hypothetical protein HFE30_06040 [Clostridiales bacterium]|nr:hypothetical protein [Clostridiales bacterium]
MINRGVVIKNMTRLALLCGSSFFFNDRIVRAMNIKAVITEKTVKLLMEKLYPNGAVSKVPSGWNAVRNSADAVKQKILLRITFYSFPSIFAYLFDKTFERIQIASILFHEVKNEDKSILT